MSRSPIVRIAAVFPMVLVVFLYLPAPLPAQDAPNRTDSAPTPQHEEAAAVETAAADEKLDIFSLLWKGGWVMIPIALASILALTITIERFISLRKIKVIPPGFLSGLKSLFEPGGVDAAKGADYCRQNPCVLGNLVEAGLPKLGQGETQVQSTLEDVGARSVDRMKRSLKPLSMIATVSPLLGLLGTVYGMIGAFQAASAAGVGKSDVLAQGIYEALVTTAAGLTLAIPVLIVYQVLNNRVDAMVDDLDTSAEDFIAFAFNHGSK